MKKFFVLALLSVFGLSACDDDDDSSADAGAVLVPGQNTINGVDVQVCQDELENFTACGGDPIGSWTLVNGCQDGDIDVSMSCMSLNGTAATMSGSFVIKNDNTMTYTVKSSNAMQMNVDTDCVTQMAGQPISCGQVAQLFAGSSDYHASCGVSGNDCLCSMKYDDATVTADCTFELTSESSADVACNVSDDSSSDSIVNFDFCVKGDQLYLKNLSEIFILKKK